MSEALEKPDRNEKGQFMPGNRWMMPRWQPGQSGRVAKYSARTLWHKVKEYVEADRPGRLTWSGLAWHLGISRQNLDKYAKGEIGRDDEDRRGLVAVLEAYRSAMEAQLEHALTSKDFATQGVIFALKNQAGWRDEKYLNVESQHKQELIVQLPPELAAHLEQQRGEKLGNVIEGEVVREPSK